MITLKRAKEIHALLSAWDDEVGGTRFVMASWNAVAEATGISILEQDQYYAYWLSDQHRLDDPEAFSDSGGDGDFTLRENDQDGRFFPIGSLLADYV